MLNKAAPSCLVPVTLGSHEWYHRNNSEMDAKILTAGDPSVVTNGRGHIALHIGAYFDVGCFITNLYHAAELDTTIE